MNIPNSVSSVIRILIYGYYTLEGFQEFSIINGLLNKLSKITNEVGQDYVVSYQNS